MTGIILKSIISVCAGFLAGCGAVYIFNRMPAKWLCDYGQEPGQEIADPYIQRVKGWPWRWVYGAGFSCLLVRLSFCDVQLAAAGLFACWAMLIIGLADLKYMIIPDQFVVMLALSAFGFIPFHTGLTDPLYGALAGACVMMLVYGAGAMVFKKKVMGQGDIKLMASLGLAIGIRGIIFVFVVSSLVSGMAAAWGMAAKRMKRDDEHPLGPYICGAGALYIFIIWPFMI